MGLDKSRPIFGRQPIAGNVYKWQPLNNIDKRKNDGTFMGKPPTQGEYCSDCGCDAIPYSQGEDYNVTYVYKLVLIGANTHRLAYVACDYVT